MQIFVADIRAAGSCQYEQELTAEKLLGTAPELVVYDHPVVVKAQAQMTDGDILVQGKIETIITYNCSRCLDDFGRKFRSTFVQAYNRDLDMIDLSDEIRETILVDFPIQVLCQPNCKGICTRCGANKNKGLCACKDEKTGVLGAHLKNFPFQ